MRVSVNDGSSLVMSLDAESCQNLEKRPEADGLDVMMIKVDMDCVCWLGVDPF